MNNNAATTSSANKEKKNFNQTQTAQTLNRSGQHQHHQPNPSMSSGNKDPAAHRSVEHNFFNKLPDLNSVENDLMKLLNDFSETRLKKYGKLFLLYLSFDLL